MVLKIFLVSCSFMQFSYRARTTKDAATPWHAPRQSELAGGDGTVPCLSKVKPNLMML